MLFEKIVNNQGSPVTTGSPQEQLLDAALAADRVHRQRLDKNKLSDKQKLVWKSIVDDLENEEEYFFSSYDARNETQQMTMRKEAIVRPVEMLAQGVSESDLNKVMPNLWSFYKNHMLAVFDNYAAAEGFVAKEINQVKHTGSKLKNFLATFTKPSAAKNFDVKAATTNQISEPDIFANAKFLDSASTIDVRGAVTMVEWHDGSYLAFEHGGDAVRLLGRLGPGREFPTVTRYDGEIELGKSTQDEFLKFYGDKIVASDEQSRRNRPPPMEQNDTATPGLIWNAVAFKLGALQVQEKLNIFTKKLVEKHRSFWRSRPALRYDDNYVAILPPRIAKKLKPSEKEKFEAMRLAYENTLAVDRSLSELLMRARRAEEWKGADLFSMYKKHGGNEEGRLIPSLDKELPDF